MILTLDRQYGKDETVGQLTSNECDFILQTIERPWIIDDTHGSTPFESCVPEGEYRLVPYFSERHGETWALVNPQLLVFHFPQDRGESGAGRYGCLIHAGNYSFDVVGCIAPGMGAGSSPNGQPMVNNSEAAMTLLRRMLGREYNHKVKITSGGSL